MLLQKSYMVCWQKNKKNDPLKAGHFIRQNYAAVNLNEWMIISTSVWLEGALP
jgi:hypothetical protein